VVTAGVPCQPHSLAARGRNKPDEMWAPTASVIAAVRPRFVLVENVLGVRRALPLWISDLRGLGFHVEEPLQASAASVGAGHIRERVWLLAHTYKEGECPVALDAEVASTPKDGNCPSLPSDAGSPGLSMAREIQGGEDRPKERRPPAECGWWSTEPKLERVAHGIPYRMDRIGALGNAQVPAVVVRAWRELYERIGKEPR